MAKKIFFGPAYSVPVDQGSLFESINEQVKLNSESGKNDQVSFAQTYKIAEKNNIKVESAKSTAERFDSFTGIKNNSPEIVSLFDFIPCYEDSFGGAPRLTRAGEFLQIKQDAILVSALSSIQSTLNSNQYPAIKSLLESNKEELQKFCSTYGESIQGLFSKIEAIKNSFDLRQNFIQGITNTLSAKSPIAVYTNFDPSLFASTSLLYQDISDNSTLISTWTNTKAWIQACIEFKEILESGTSYGLFALNPLNVPSSKKDADSPFILTSAKNSEKFKFNVVQRSFPVDLYKMDLSTDTAQFSQVKNILKSVFSSTNSSIFNVSMRSLVQDDSKSKVLSTSIARISYILTRELLYSRILSSETTLRDKLVDASSGYGYPNNKLDSISENSNNKNIFDYLIGIAQNDITDFPVNQNNLPGKQNSLISLCQYQASNPSNQENNFEVLSFETRYITDDVGSPRPQSIITPGSEFFVESILSLNPSDASFFTENLSLFVKKLGSVKQNLNFINHFIFGELPSAQAYSFDDILSANSFEIQNPYHPSSLIRRLETVITGYTRLLNRELSSDQPSVIDSFSQNIKSNELDYSHLLISSALENSDSDLLALIFMYVMSVKSATARYQIIIKIPRHSRKLKSDLLGIFRKLLK